MQDMNCILYTKFKKIYQKKDKIFRNRNADKKKKQGNDNRFGNSHWSFGFVWFFFVCLFVLRAYQDFNIVPGSWQIEPKIVSVLKTEIYQTFMAMKSKVTKIV